MQASYFFTNPLDKVWPEQRPTVARIPESELQRLKEEISVQRLVEAAGIELKASGKDRLGRCPFHDDAEPSLVVASRGFARGLRGLRGQVLPFAP